MPRCSRRCRLLPFALLALAACAPAAAPSGPAARAVPPPSSAPATAAPPAPPGPVGTGYDKPPAAILDVLHAPSPPRPEVSPTGEAILLVSWIDYPPMSRVAEPFLKLAGARIEPKNRSKHDTPGGYGINPCARAMDIARVADGALVHVATPGGGCLDAPYWSADGKRIVFRNATANAVELWVADAATGQTHPVAGARLNPMMGYTTQWMPDQRTLLVKLVPDSQGPPPPAPAVPNGPSIEETDGRKGESSTYETRDTLGSKHDEELFDYYALAQLALVDAASGAITRIGKPGLYGDVDIAPDGDHLLVQTVERPYSYDTTFDRFPRAVEVWDHAGHVTHPVASIPLADRVPVQGVRTGPRDFSWRSTEPATLVWAEALDGGDWKAKVPARDKIMMQKAPFTAAPVELVRLEQRYAGIVWGERKDTALLREIDENRHWARTFVVDVDDAPPTPRLLWDLSSDEHYKNPGEPVMRTLPSGAPVMRQDGAAIYLAGDGSSPAGDRPFLDHLDLATRASQRIFRSDASAYERVLDVLDASGHGFVTWRQSPTEPPNAFLRTAGAPVAAAPAGEAALTSTMRPLTHTPDAAPAVRAIKKRLVKYKRKDGTDLSFTLYTPPGYQEGTRVPAILYAYPLDYADPKTAGQVTGSQQYFTRLYQYQLLLLAGYAILDDAAFPIVGDPKKAYDTYLEQLVADARAAVDKAVELGVVDRDRIGVTGHSHGALMTANLLAHSDLFRAGAATSGSYNKTLTPFGFQNERRSVWDAESVYLKVSPFFVANKMKLPLLIIHGQDDANPGTTPLQATKLYEAIRGNGGTARLVMLPHEPHWYSAMESNEQEVYEMVRWFDKYVKNAPAAK